MRKSIIAIVFIFLGLNTLNAAETKAAEQAPGLPVQTFVVTKQENTTNKTYSTFAHKT